MAWYDNAIIYHIYPLGFCGAPQFNEGKEPVNRIKKVIEWIPHLKEMNIDAVYFGPVFESVEHGYDTTDYKKIDNRLGTNADFKEVCDALHENGIKVILDGVFNHVGRNFPQFQDIIKNGQSSPYCGWFENLNFGGNSPCGDPFWYEGWNGFYNLVKLNQKNPEVSGYFMDVINFWMDEFDIDGIRFDAADCIDFDFFRKVRHLTKSRKPEFWLMGEIIHGDYNRWANSEMLDSVTNYECYKGIYSSHNTKNYFEIDYSINRQYGTNGAIYKNIDLYDFVDNHDVNRLASTLEKQEYLENCYILLYAMPGIPSIYYGSEYGIKGIHENNSDAGLRPCLDLKDLEKENTKLYKHIVRLGRIYKAYPAMRSNEYHTVIIRNQQMCFEKVCGDQKIYVALNLDENPYDLNFGTDKQRLVDILSGKQADISNGNAHIKLEPYSGVILVEDDIINNADEEEPEEEERPEINIGDDFYRNGVKCNLLAFAEKEDTSEIMAIYKELDSGKIYVVEKANL